MEGKTIDQNKIEEEKNEDDESNADEINEDEPEADEPEADVEDHAQENFNPSLERSKYFKEQRIKNNSSGGDLFESGLHIKLTSSEDESKMNYQSSKIPAASNALKSSMVSNTQPHKVGRFNLNYQGFATDNEENDVGLVQKPSSEEENFTGKEDRGDITNSKRSNEMKEETSSLFNEEQVHSRSFVLNKREDIDNS